MESVNKYNENVSEEVIFFLKKRRRAALHYIKKKDGLRTLYTTHHTPHFLTDYIRARELAVEVTEPYMLTIREWGGSQEGQLPSTCHAP